MASFISVFMPLHYWYTNAIDGDHHALESLMALFLFNSFMEVYKDNSLKEITKFAICLLIIFLIWQGAILYAGIIVLYVFGYILLYSRDYQTSRYLGFSIVFTAIIIFGLMTLLPPYKPSLHFGRYSFFSPTGLVMSGFFLTGLSYFGEKKKSWAIVQVILFLIFALILKDEIIKGLNFLTGREKGFVSVLEMQSIFKLGWWKGKIDNEFILRSIFFLYLFVPLISIYYALKKDKDLHFVVYLIAFFAILTFIQRRFTYIYAPFICIALIFIWSKIKSRNFFIAYTIFFVCCFYRVGHIN